MRRAGSGPRLWGAVVLLAAVLTASPWLIAPAAAKPDRLNMSLPYPVGSVIIVNSERRIYYVAEQGQVLRYPVAVGKAEELWLGRTFVSSKVVDPRWIPVDGSDPIEGGEPDNPLGKRALYLDWSLLRIHGTPSRGSVGRAVSNGCIRMLDEDVMDLFERVHLGAPVFAIHSLREPRKFEDVKVGEKVYVNPEARRVAKEIEADSQRALAEDRSFQRSRWEEPRWSQGSAFSTPSRRRQQAQDDWDTPAPRGNRVWWQ